MPTEAMSMSSTVTALVPAASSVHPELAFSDKIFKRIIIRSTLVIGKPKITIDEHCHPWNEMNCLLKIVVFFWQREFTNY